MGAINLNHFSEEVKEILLSYVGVENSKAVRKQIAREISYLLKDYLDELNS